MLNRCLKYVLKGYQYLISPMLLPACRFHPNCSEYAIQALDKHSFLKALAVIGWRVLKCQPLHPGGYDPVK